MPRLPLRGIFESSLAMTELTADIPPRSQGARPWLPVGALVAALVAGIVVAAFVMDDRHVNRVVTPMHGSGAGMPTDGRHGSWISTLRLDAAGPYRVFADFQTRGVERVLGTDLAVAGAYKPLRLPAAATSASVDGYRVTANRDAGSGAVRFRVWRDGKRV